MLFLSLFLQNAIATPEVDVVSGFRLGYGYVADSELRSPHMMILGWDQMHSIKTGTVVDAIIAGNISIGGINQGTLFPSAHFIVGYQILDQLQFGVGPVVTFTELSPQLTPRLNMITAAGWNIKMGDIYIPLHVAYVPDLDGRWRAYLTTGMNWPIKLKGKG